jgi:hypothetical protein
MASILPAEQRVTPIQAPASGPSRPATASVLPDTTWCGNTRLVFRTGLLPAEQRVTPDAGACGQPAAAGHPAPRPGNPLEGTQPIVRVRQRGHVAFFDPVIRHCIDGRGLRAA